MHPRRAAIAASLVTGLLLVVPQASAQGTGPAKGSFTTAALEGEAGCNNIQCPVNVLLSWDPASRAIRSFDSSAFIPVDCPLPNGGRTVGVGLHPFLSSIPATPDGRFEYHGGYTIQDNGFEASTNRQLDLVGRFLNNNQVSVDFHVRAELTGHTSTCIAEVSRTVIAKRIPDIVDDTPKPTLGKTAVVRVVSGTVRVRRPGSKRFVKLGEGENLIPIGSVLDTRKGRVQITVGIEDGKTQTSDFFDGVFQLNQKKAKRPVTEAKLVGKREGCGRAGPRHARAAASVKGRKLWGSGKGRFRTTGRRSSATVRGTIWLVVDRCDDATITRVRKGRVAVRDFVKKKTVIVTTGRRYVAKGR